MWLAFQRQRLHTFPGPKITPRVFNWEIWFYNGSRSHIFLTEPKINHYLSESMWWKNLPVNHRSSKRRNQIYLIFILSFFVLWGEGAIYGSYHYQPRDNLVFKEGGYFPMIETCQCVIRVSVYVPCGRYHRWYQVEKLSVQKAKSVKKIFWPPRIDLFLPKFHCGCTDWKQKRALLWLSPLLSSNSNLLFAL